MPRLLFEKTGDAIWMSHLDLMRLMQRAFKRAGFNLTHTQGFNQRPSVSIALPMSVGVESVCELLDFDLDGEMPSCEVIRDGLNSVLVSGVRVLDVYENGAKIRDIAYLDCQIQLEYDNGVTDEHLHKIQELFAREGVTVEKKGKNGVTEQDIIPMIRSITVEKQDDNSILLQARICCQNPTLNPAQIPLAISRYLPDMAPDFSICRRLEIYDKNENPFR